jgi:hypothetical protein
MRLIRTPVADGSSRGMGAFLALPHRYRGGGLPGEAISLGFRAKRRQSYFSGLIMNSPDFRAWVLPNQQLRLQTTVDPVTVR